MRRNTSFWLSMLFLFTAISCKTQRAPQSVSANRAQTAAISRPVLVIGIVVDQMRYDYLYRYWDKYSNDGFKRLIGQGFSCENTNYNYVPTYTAPGHSAIYTGSMPAYNGMVGNEWYDRSLGRDMYCVEDTTVQSVGVEHAVEGQMSPRNLLSSTITDELRLSNLQGKVIGISLKDRGAILPAGHAANAAYWYDGKTGQWISSTYYMNSLPQWVKDFNARKLPAQYLSSPWNTLLPINQYTESTADDVPYEAPFKGESKPVFPHDLPALRGNEYGLLRETPFGNTLTRELAEAAMQAESLGEDSITDFLAISFSSTDYVGHQFGPNAIETEDTYLRLDRDIAHLLRYTDSAYGQGKVLIFLTADHGGATNPTYLTSQNLKIPGGLFSGKKAVDSLKNYLNQKYGKANWVESYANQQVYLNHKLMQDKNIRPEEIEAQCVAFLSTFPGVATVISGSELRGENFTSGLESFVDNGYYAPRSGDVAIVLRPGWMEYKPTGTTHGSPYTYDTHVPLLWYGWHVKAGSTDKPVHIQDIAATLAAMLRIQAPNAATGKPIWNK